MNPSSFLRRMRGALALMAVGVALAPTTASALDTNLVPSIGADTGRFTLPISCQISVGTLKLIKIGGTVDIQGIAPVQLGPGQAFYLSQGSGALTLPAWLSTLGGIATINKADATVSSLKIGATRSTPATVDLSRLYDLSVTDVPVVSGKPITVGLPKTGSFRVGPYIAPADGRVQFRFEGATADVTLKSSLGLKIKVHAECAASQGNALLSVAVGSQVDPSKPALFEGEPLSYPTVAAGNLIGIVNAPYKCDIGGQRYDVGVAVGGVIPLAVKRTGTLSITQASGAITLPATTVNRLMDAGVTSIQGKVDELKLIVDNGTPANPNVLPGGTAIPSTSLVRDKAVVLSLPTNGTVTAGPFKPSATAASMVIGMGSAAATLQFNGSNQTVPVSCPKPEPDALLVDAPIL
ncbi:MAG TPA: DUF6801 domain-containing protein [Aquabacterium sp.]|uniref:DUF6801 domain-containing protein n=1 Tax=Aquabacterium sp. TaxID=1872578 RepID=UPI002E3614EC|nr:DUF6801 domain-containing protein [Aquabacterium sp.]HEX5357946.1 DUF6801 domain-containing protein [Aquabacterium sp.]